MLRCAVVLAGLAGCSSLAAADDCRSSGCDNGGSCCMCSCDAGDYVVGSFSCNCDDTPKHKPLPNADQPKCCGGEFGFDAWCLKQDSPAVHNLQCSDQTPKGKPLPSKDFYEFSTSNFRCVYPPATCLSAFCDNPAVPDLDHHVCHKPYEPSPGPAPKTPAPKTPAPKAPAPKAPAPKAPAPKAPAPKAPAPKAPAPKTPAPMTPAPSMPPSPATCAADANRPNGCTCDHSFQCASEWCTGKPAKCEKHPGSLRANADGPGAKPALF